MSEPVSGRLIPLTQGFFAIVDEEDFARVSCFKWQYNGGYARRTIRVAGIGRQPQILHRFIMGDPPDMEVDHKSLNKLDCRKQNLRICTKAQNHRNRGVQRNNKSGFKGVSWNFEAKKWHTVIYSDGIRRSLGFFDDPVEAAETYDAAAAQLHGEFAKTNRDLNLIGGSN